MNNPKTEEIVAILRHCATHNCIMCPAYSPPNSKCFETLAAACDRLEWLEKELSKLKAQQRWIPVTERLPEDDDDVLIMSSGSISMGYYSVYNEYWADYINVYYDDVTHWMPLPESPKEEERCMENE